MERDFEKIFNYLNENRYKYTKILKEKEVDEDIIRMFNYNLLLGKISTKCKKHIIEKITNNEEYKELFNDLFLLIEIRDEVWTQLSNLELRWNYKLQSNEYNDILISAEGNLLDCKARYKNKLIEKILNDN